MKLMKIKAMLLMCLVVLIVGCFGSTDGGDPAPDKKTPIERTSEISGKVADGYLKNATVFLDLDGDKVYDTGEPKTTTDSVGSYTLEVSDDEIGSYPIVVLITDKTRDLDDIDREIKPYTMTAPPPNGANEDVFVSPITTMIHNKMEKDKSLNRSDAELKTRGELGAEVNLFEDYVENGENESSDGANKKIHRIAQLVARKIEKITAVLGDDVDEKKKSALASLIISLVVETIDEIKIDAVNTDNINSETGLVELTTLHEIDDDDAIVSDDVKDNLDDALEKEKLKIDREIKSFKDIVDNGGSYSIRRSSDGGLKIVLHTVENERLIKEESYNSGNEWSGPEKKDFFETFYNNGEMKKITGKAAYTEDGSLKVLFENYNSFLVSGQEVDISGKKIRNHIDKDIVLKDNSAIFPAGSKGYSLIFVDEALKDYCCFSFDGDYIKDDKIMDWNGNNFTSVDAFLNKYVVIDENGFNKNRDWFKVLSLEDGDGYCDNVVAQVKSVADKTLYISRRVGWGGWNDGGERFIPIFAQTATYEIKTIGGEKMLVFSIPDFKGVVEKRYCYLESSKLTKDKNTVVARGYQYKKGNRIYQDQGNGDTFDFNKTAIDAIKGKIDCSATCDSN